jgi:AraC-like DNA-binding protein
MRMTVAVIRHVLPTATGFATRQAIAALRKRDVAVGPLLRRVGLSEQDVDSPKRRISAAAQSKFLEYAAEALGDSAFGLHLAEEANPREAGLLFYVASATDNVGEGLALYARCCRVVNEAVQVNLLPDEEGVVVEFELVGISRHQASQTAEFVLAIAVKTMRELVGRDVHPTRVTFAHTRHSDAQEFKRFFNCLVEYGALSDLGSFSNGILALPLLTRDPHLLEALHLIGDEAAKERNTPKATVRALVENEAQKLLPHGKVNRQTVASALGMSERTLARKLAEESTSYEQVLDQLRLSLARQYIKDRGISLSQIAWLLGYGESTSFSHAFTRWTGASPSAARSEKQLRGLGKIRRQTRRH